MKAWYDYLSQGLIDTINLIDLDFPGVTTDYLLKHYIVITIVTYFGLVYKTGDWGIVHDIDCKDNKNPSNKDSNDVEVTEHKGIKEEDIDV